MLRSTFAGFSVAHLAMAASQNALDVVGQNVSNINTVGYTRQRLDQISVSPTGHSMMNSKFSVKVGQGVMATGVSQIRDPFLDIQYRTQLAEVGTVDAMDTILDRIGDVFDETSSTAIREALNNVVSQLQNMARPDTAGQDTYDTLVRSAMEGLLNLFHERANDITDIQEEYVSRIQGTEGQKIEGYLSKIVELNEAIKNSNILGSPALELNDQRNQLIDELATYLPIDVTYEDQNVGGNITVDTLKITFTDSNGVTHTLIDDDQRGTVNITSNNGMPPLGVEITGVGGAATDVTDALGNGVLKGYADMLNKEGIFDGTDTKGVGFYGSYFDTFVHEFATTLNQLNDDGTGTKFLFETSDGSATFTAENIRISQGWMDGSVSVTTTKGGGDTAYENVQRMINAITSDVHDITTPGGATVFSGNFLDAYDFLQNTQAAERSSTSTILANRTAVLSQIADSKDSISAISLDEEVMNLMKYQQSYNAAARLMTTLDEALDTLINNTGVVGR